MEPFNIICKTCAARLKVRKQSLIGQTLACPKCGSMVKVEAPEGWVPDPADVSKSVSDSEFNSENFDDIDSLIKREQDSPSPPSLPPKPLPIPEATKKPSPKPTTSAPVQTDAAQSPEPLLPNQSWVSSESKKRQKLTMILAASVAGLLLIIATITALVINSNKKSDTDPEQVAQKDDDSELAEPKEEPADPEPNGQDTTEQTAEQPNETTAPPVETETETETETTADPIGPIDSPPDNKTPTGNNPNENAGPTETPLVPQPPAPNDPNDQQKEQDPLEELDLENNFQPNFDNDPILGNLLSTDTVATRMGELNNLLAENGATLGEIGSIADAIQDKELVGVPKYFFEKPTTKPVNITQFLSNDIAGIQYQDGSSLVDFTRDMQTMIGAPISLHVESLLAADLSLDPRLDFERNDLKLYQVIDIALADAGMIKVQTELGLVILAKAWDAPTKKQFPVQPMPADLAGFVRKVRGMFGEEAWSENTAIEFEGNELVVTQTPQVSAQIKILLEKLNAAHTLNADPTNEVAQRTLQTRWALSQAARETKTEFRHVPARTITRFLREIEQQADVRILIDWNSLAPAGWTPATLVPGQFNEPTVGESLAQLSRGMGVTYRAVGEKTFEVMAFQEAAGRPELQIYPVGGIVNDTLKSSDLMEILWSTVQVDQRLIQISYVDEINGVLVIAPQSIQRQFEAVINRLRGPEK